MVAGWGRFRGAFGCSRRMCWWNTYRDSRGAIFFLDQLGCDCSPNAGCFAGIFFARPGVIWDAIGLC